MYKAVGVNEYDQVYNIKGVLDQYKEGLDSSIREFEGLSEAVKYADEFIKTYPQVRFKICSESEVVKELFDQEYWDWKESNSEEWSTLNKKGHKLSRILLNVFLGVVGLFVALVAQYSGSIPFYLKLLVFPLAIIIGWHVINRIFARMC